jgi:hypothetical protein
MSSTLSDGTAALTAAAESPISTARRSHTVKALPQEAAASETLDRIDER